MRKIIFLDVDGTLVPFNNIVSNNVIEAIRQARENGHFIFLCTGRAKCAVEVFESIGFDGYICGAGSYIEVNKQIIFDQYLNKQETNRIKTLFEKNHFSYNLEAKNATYQDQRVMRLIQLGKLFFKKEMELIIKKYCLQHISLYQYEPVYKMSFISLNKKKLIKVKHELENEYHFLIHKRRLGFIYNGEIIKKGFDKASAINKVLQYMHINKEDTICFGDSQNDLEMFQTCHYAVMMKNGYHGLKQYASSICESVEDDGIYYELKRLGLIDEKAD